MGLAGGDRRGSAGSAWEADTRDAGPDARLAAELRTRENRRRLGQSQGDPVTRKRRPGCDDCNLYEMTYNTTSVPNLIK